MLHYLIKSFLTSNCKFIVIVLLILPLFLGGRTESEAKVKATAVLTNINKIDVCGDKKNKAILLVLDIGKITWSDSLFACNFELNYDSSKVKISSALYLNTLSEFFEFKEISYRSGKIIGVLSVSLLGDQVAGDKALIAFSGEYLENCEDTASVNISYLEFTDEFQKDITEYKSAIVKGETLDKPDRSLTATLSDYKFDNLKKDSTAEITVRLKTYKIARLKNIDFKLFFDKPDIFEIKEISEINSNILKIDTIIKNDSDILIKTTVNDTITDTAVFKMIVRQSVNLSDTVNLKLTLEDINRCSCITRKYGSSAVLIAGKIEIDTLNVVDRTNSDIRGYYDIENNEFVIIDENENEKNIEVFDLMGNLITKQNGLFGKKIEIKTDKLSSGLYILKINVNKTIILIKN